MSYRAMKRHGGVLNGYSSRQLFLREKSVSNEWMCPNCQAQRATDSTCHLSSQDRRPEISSMIDKRHAIPLGYKGSTETRIASNMIHHCLEINFIKSA